MKKIYYSTVLVAGLLGATACSDYLETSSPSVVDADFVFSNTRTTRAALDGAYESWRAAAQGGVFGDGLFYAADVCGSDIERHPENFKNQPGRHYVEGLYQNGTYAGSYGLTSYLKENDIYAKLYACISKANAVCTAMEATPQFADMMAQTKPSEMSQMYGEAVAMRATVYRELIKNFGDVPYVDHFGDIPMGLTNRDSIYDAIIAQLQKIEPLMYEIGNIPGIDRADKHYFSRTYTQALIARLCMEAGGFQTRRGDIDRTGYTYEQKGSENNGATYGRRSDWENLYKIAKTQYEKLLANPGNAQFHLTDPRGASDKAGRTFNNPYQYFFEQMHEDDAIYADESIYEYPQQQGNGNDGRPYSFGRPSSGGSKAAYPCKSYGQGRINPAYYYGIFDPQDMRRDVSVCVTGSDGKGNEKLISFAPNSKAEGGGLSLNKWDENRQTKVWVAAQRTSGINGPYMRMAEVYLGYAEVCAALNEVGIAKDYLKIVRERSFPAGEAHTDEFIASCGSLLRAVVEERGFEFAGEGDRRWTLLRTGFFPDAIRRIKAETKDMMDDLEKQGYHTFDNGNQISLYVWTKMVDAKAEYGHRLTAQTPVGKENDPVLAPGWRGQNDDWESYGCDYKDNTKTNVAIQGLFRHIEPGSAEALALEADGYKMVNWGKDLVANRDEYDKYLFWDYDYQKAPIYLWPFTPNVLTAGGFTNGYGFQQK